MKRWVARVGSVGLGVALGLALCELGLRVSGYGSPVSGVDVGLRWEPGSPYLERSGDPSLVLKPGFVGQMVYRNLANGAVVKAIDVAISEQGLRSPPLDPTRARPRVLGVGDSVTFGQGVRSEETFLAVFASLTETPVELLNAGVPSWSLADQVAWIEESAEALDPDLLLLCTYFHDVASSPRMPPEGVDRPIIQRAPGWALREGGLRRWSFLVNLVARVADRRRLERDLAEVPRSRASPQLTYFEELRSQLDRDAIRGRYRALRAHCDATRVPCVVVILPLVISGSDDPVGSELLGTLETLAEDARLPVVRVDDALADMSALERYVLPADQHPSAQAHAAIGRVLADRLPLPASARR